MKHIRADRVVSLAEIDAIVSDLKTESERALRLGLAFAVGWSEGLNLAIKRLEKLEGR
jgi:hypothetical protein